MFSKIILRIFIISWVCIPPIVQASDFLSDSYWQNVTIKDVKNAIANGADVNARNKYGSTPLMYASWDNQNPDVITTLINAGADVNARNKDGWTPLMYASRSNQNPDVITTLINAGADATIKDGEGKTAYDYILKNDALKDSKVLWKLNDLRFK